MVAGEAGSRIAGHVREDPVKFGKRASANQLHREVVDTIGLARIEDRNDVRVLPSSQNVRLALEASQRARVPANMFGEHLERHRHVGRLLTGIVNESHAAPTENTKYFVV